MKKLTSFILAILLTLAVFCSCANGGEDTVTTDAIQTSTTYWSHYIDTDGFGDPTGKRLPQTSGLCTTQYGNTSYTFIFFNKDSTVSLWVKSIVPGYSGATYRISLKDMTTGDKHETTWKYGMYTNGYTVIGGNSEASWISNALLSGHDVGIVVYSYNDVKALVKNCTINAAGYTEIYNTACYFN